MVLYSCAVAAGNLGPSNHDVHRRVRAESRKEYDQCINIRSTKYCRDLSPPCSSLCVWGLLPSKLRTNSRYAEKSPGCGVTFWCGQQAGTPVTWNVNVGPDQIFTYWPGKTDTEDGNVVDLEAALLEAGLAPDDARRRTTCLVRSSDPVEARAYTRIGGEFTSVANQAERIISDGYAPVDQSEYNTLLLGTRAVWRNSESYRQEIAFDVYSLGRFYQTDIRTLSNRRRYDAEGIYLYQRTGAYTATVITYYDRSNQACTAKLTFTSRTTSTRTASCRGSRTTNRINNVVDQWGHVDRRYSSAASWVRPANRE